MAEAVTNWPELLAGLVRHEDQSAETTAWAMQQILRGEATAAQLAALSWRCGARGNRHRAGRHGRHDDRIRHPDRGASPAVDIVGSGGDRAHTVNISTMAAIVMAAAGARGQAWQSRCLVRLWCSRRAGSAGRRARSRSGTSADSDRADRHWFLFAAHYHPALALRGRARGASSASRRPSISSTLANPAQPIAEAVGGADARMAELMAGVFAARGNQGLVMHGDDGLDEMTTTTSSAVWVYADGQVRTRFDPADDCPAPSCRIWSAAMPVSTLRWSVIWWLGNPDRCTTS